MYDVTTHLVHLRQRAGGSAHAHLRRHPGTQLLADAGSQKRSGPGDPARMAARIIESVVVEPAPPRMVLGSQALESTLTTLRKRIAGFEAQTELAASTDFQPGE